MPNNIKIVSLVNREIAGYHENLHKGFSQLGVVNHFFSERPHAFYNKSEGLSSIETIILFTTNIIERQRNKKILFLLTFLLVYPLIVILKIMLFIVFLKKYNVFIYGGNYSLLGFFIDRYIIRLCGKKIIDIVSGSDVRPPYLNGAYQNFSMSQIRFETLRKYRKIQSKLKTNDYLIDHPSVSQFHTKNYIPHLYVGFPFYLPPQPFIQENKRPLILHAPSNPRYKGTSIIREIINEVKEEGYYFDYEELTGIPHEKVLKKIQRCHFVINQLYSDTPMSGLDREAAYFGKPSIVGGYNLEMIEKSIKGYDVPPTYRIFPSKENLKKAIIHLLTDKVYAKTLGIKAQDFIKKNWDAKVVAQKYLDIINGNIPSDIIRSPLNDIDIFGAGINYEVRKKIIRTIIKNYSTASLCLNHHPKLKDAVIRDLRIEHLN